MKRYHMLLMCGAILIAAEVVVIRFVTRERPHDCSPPTYQWINVKRTASSSRESVLFDAMIADIMTNPDLKSTRAFYGGPHSNLVAYGHFPQGYTPTVKGYVFECPTNPPSREPRLGIYLDGLWIDRDFQEDDTTMSGQFLCIDQRHTKRGALLAVGCSGGCNTIGACSVGYAIEEIQEGWRISYLGMNDP